MVGLYMALVLILLLMSIIDIEHRILPDSLQLLLFSLGILKLFWHGDMQESLLGMAAAGGLGCALHYGYPLIRKREGLGFGDVKFFAIAGLWVGASGLPLFFLLSGLGGVILGVAWRMIYKQAQFPFGPALAVALWGTLLCRDMGWL
jgi:prepilin signal peptidase PulO-like enzyme (type II secretory pathway)